MSKSRIIAIACSAVGAALIASPAAASRCGGSLGIDEATTLAEVAQRCNVNLSALYEANPGVDPRNVTTGTYLAIPDEIEEYAPFNGGAAPVVASVDDDQGADGYVSPDVSPFADQATNPHRMRDLYEASNDPAWFRASTGGGARSYAADRRSYQQRSAARIHNAGVPSLPAPLNPALRNSVSAKAGEAELISCAVLHNDDNGKLRKVRKIISTPTDTYVEVVPTSNGKFDCTLIKAVSSSDVALTPGVPAAHYGTAPRTPAIKTSRYRLPDFNAINPKAAKAPQKISVSGAVIGEADGCLVLDAGAGGKWALASAPGADSLVGKHVTAWGVASHSGACGAAPTMIVSHAVYAEPWTGR